MRVAAPWAGNYGQVGAVGLGGSFIICVMDMHDAGAYDAGTFDVSLADAPVGDGFIAGRQPWRRDLILGALLAVLISLPIFII